MSHNGKATSIVRNGLVGYLCLATSLVSGIVLTPILLKLLGPANYGLWIFLSSLVGYLGLAELGIGGATSRRVAAATASGDAAELRRVLSSAFALYVVIAAIGAAAVCVIAVGLPFIGRIPAAQLGSSQAAVLVLGTAQVINFLLLVRTATIVGVGRMDLTALFGAVTTLLGSGAQVGLLVLGAGVPGMAVVAAVTSIVSVLYTSYIVRLRFPEARVDLREARLATARELLRFGGRNALVAVCGTLAFSADAAMIGMILPMAAVTQYAIAAKLVGLLRTLALKPIDVLLPAYAHAQRLGEHQRMERLFTESIGIALAIAIPGVICLTAFATRIFQLWLGARHADSYPILVVLAAVLLVQLPGHASATLLTGTDRTVFLTRIAVVGAFCNVVISVFLLRLLGVIGPALGTLCTVVVIDMFVLPWSVCRQFDFSLQTVLRQSIRPLIVPTLISGLLAAAVVRVHEDPSPVLTLAGIAGVGLTFVAAWLTLGVPRQQREKYAGLARRVLPFLPHPATGATK